MNSLEKSNKKAAFVDDLKKFYFEKCDNNIGCSDIVYGTEDSNEYVVMFFGNVYKRFSINGDNFQGILIDFVKFITDFNEYPWEWEHEA